MYRADYLKGIENARGIFKTDWGIRYDASVNDTIIATLFTVSPEYYFYYDRLKNYQPGDVSFSEPYPMYTNINGGFGIFVGFNKQELRVLLK